MVARGRVSNGVVVLEDGVQLPEGRDVTVVLENGASGSSEETRGTHRLLDIPTFSVGAVLQPLTNEDDLLGEMLERRV